MEYKGSKSITIENTPFTQELYEAAPEMYEALKTAEMYLKEISKGNHEVMITFIEQALSKARGKEA